MWKPRVLLPRTGPALGRGAAGFAGEILRRHGPPPDSERYPEAWLVFREEEEREAAQAAGETRLTQLTLRLALQLNESFTLSGREEHTAMEVNSLRETLRTCLTALESRDRLLCREVRTLLRLAPGQREEVRKERETLRERLLYRLEQLERRERTEQIRESEQAGQPERTVRLKKSGESQSPSAGDEDRSQASAPAGIQRQTVSLAARLWRQAGRYAQRSAVEIRAEHRQRQLTATLTRHKEQFLQILSRTDSGDKERLWRLAEEYQHPAIRRLERRGEEPLYGAERLERLVRESTQREYVELLRLLERHIRPGRETEREEPDGAQEETRASRAGGAERPRRADGEAGVGVQALKAQAAPLLAWLEQTMEEGQVRRGRMLARLEREPEPVWRAFLALAGRSGVFHTLKKTEYRDGAETPAAWEQLTLLTRKSRRQELERLLQWTERIQTREEGEPTAPRQRAAGREETVLRSRELRQFLTWDGRESRRELLRLLEAARPEERAALLTGLREAAGEEAAPAAGEKGSGEAGREVLRLLERGRDWRQLLEGAEASLALRQETQARSREERVLQRLSRFVQSRGSTWETERVRLLQGLDGAEKQILLRHLQTVETIRREQRREPAGVVRPEEAGGQDPERQEPETPERTLIQTLAFRTQKEYKSFRYHLTRYLAQQPPPAPPLLSELRRWAERRETQKLAAEGLPALPPGDKGEGLRPAGQRAGTGQARWADLLTLRTERLYARVPEGGGREQPRLPVRQSGAAGRRGIRSTAAPKELSPVYPRGVLPVRVGERAERKGAQRNGVPTPNWGGPPPTEVFLTAERLAAGSPLPRQRQQTGERPGPVLPGADLRLLRTELEEPELALRRNQGPSAVRESARRAVRERVELAVQRQAPELRLLRRQSQEQERLLEQQKNDLTGLKQRLEQQEALLRKAVEGARAPGGEEPARVRQLAKAVMKEMEGQLRLERQRRGLG